MKNDIEKEWQVFIDEYRKMKLQIYMKRKHFCVEMISKTGFPVEHYKFWNENLQFVLDQIQEIENSTSNDIVVDMILSAYNDVIDEWNAISEDEEK